MHLYSFEKLEVWNLSRQVRKEVYMLTKKFPREEMFGLTSQVKRSVSSIMACIAEGSGKITPKDKAYYSNLSYATTLETINHLIAALDLNYITESEYRTLRLRLEKIGAMLTALRKAQLSKLRV